MEGLLVGGNRMQTGQGVDFKVAGYAIRIVQALSREW